MYILAVQAQPPTFNEACA